MICVLWTPAPRKPVADRASGLFGSYSSPNYETAARVIPAWPTRTGVPERQGTNTIGFTLFLPSGAAPAGTRG